MNPIVLRVCLLMVLVIYLSKATKKDYTGYEIIRIHVQNTVDAAVVATLLDNKPLKVEMWTELDKETVDLQVPPESVQTVEDILTGNNVKHEVDIQNIQEEINRETEQEKEAEESESRKRRNLLRSRRSSDDADILLPEDGISFDIIGKYVDWKKMTTWWYELQQNYPTIVNLTSIGFTTEGREMKVVKISKGNRKKPVMWIDANIHAREWITSATANYVIKKLVTEYGSDKTITRLVDHYDWYILPVVNPDGFQYTHTTDRLWRKTRSKQSWSCYGVDPNRNWGYHWADCCRYTEKTCTTWRDFYSCGSDNPCENVFFGKKPFSEPETRSTADFIMSHKDEIKLYLSLHSYSQMWLQNWGYTKTKPKDSNEIDRLSKIGVSALKAVHNVTYTVGSPAALLYTAAGGSYDWAKGVAGIKYAFTLELRDQGQHGFLLPMDQIIPTAEETWAAIQAMAQDLMKN